MKKDGTDEHTLAGVKGVLVADQKAVLDERRDAACKELRASRDEQYKELLNHQQVLRAGLRDRQKAGLDNALFLDHAKSAGKDLSSGFRGAAGETAAPQGRSERPEKASEATKRREYGTTRSGANRGDVRLRAGFSVGSLLDALFSDLVNAGSAPPERDSEREAAEQDLFDAAAQETQKREHRQREVEDEEWRRQRERPL